MAVSQEWVRSCGTGMVAMKTGCYGVLLSWLILFFLLLLSDLSPVPSRVF